MENELETKRNELVMALDEAIYEKYKLYGMHREAVIVMHPETWYSIIRSKEYEAYTASVIVKDNSKFKGCSLIRSYDIKEGEFEVLFK